MQYTGEINETDITCPKFVSTVQENAADLQNPSSDLNSKNIAVNTILKVPLSPKKISGNDVGTFLNQGQQYEMELNCASIHRHGAFPIRTAIQLGIFDNKFNVDGDQKFDKWSLDHPCNNVMDIKSDNNDINVAVQKMDSNGSRWDVRWSSSNQVKLYLTVNIIGTDFDEIKHGCEGVIFTLKCESFCEVPILSDPNSCPLKSYISCIRLKVFKCKGGDRKLRDDIKKFMIKGEEYKRDIQELQNINFEIEKYKSQLPVSDTLHKINYHDNERLNTDIEFIQALGENYIINKNIFQTDQKINNNNTDLNENQMNSTLMLSENIINNDKESKFQLLEKDIEKEKIIINRDRQNNLFCTDIVNKSIFNEINIEKNQSLYNLEKDNEIKLWTIENSKLKNEQDARKQKSQLEQKKIMEENQIEQMRIETLKKFTEDQEKINSVKILRDMQNREYTLSQDTQRVKSQLSLKMELFNKEKELEIKDFDLKTNIEKEKIFKDAEREKEKLTLLQTKILRESEMEKEKLSFQNAKRIRESEIEKEKLIVDSEIEKEKLSLQHTKVLRESEMKKEQLLVDSEIEKEKLSLQHTKVLRESEIEKEKLSLNQFKKIREYEMDAESNKLATEMEKKNELRRKFLENEKIMSEKLIILHNAQLETEYKQKQRKMIEINVVENAREKSVMTDLEANYRYMEKRLEEEKFILKEQYENKEREIERQKILNDMELKKLQVDYENQAFHDQKCIEDESKQKLNELVANTSIELKEAEKVSIAKKLELKKNIYLRADEIKRENELLANDAKNRKILTDQKIRNQKFINSQTYQSLKKENFEIFTKGIKTIQDMKNNRIQGSKKNSDIDSFNRQRQEALERLQELANESEYKKSLIKNKYEQLMNLYTLPSGITVLQQPSNDRDRQSLFNFEKTTSYPPPSYESILCNQISNQSENQMVNPCFDQMVNPTVDQMNDNYLQPQKRKTSFTSYVDQALVSKHESGTIPIENLATISHLIRNMNHEDLNEWLQRNRFYEASKILVNFSGAELLNLSKEELSEIVGVVDAIRLRNLLAEIKNTNFPFIFVTLEDAYGQICESVYRPISLKSFDINELILGIQNNYPTFPMASIYNLYITNINGDILGLDDSIIRQFAPDSKFNVKFSMDSNNPTAINVLFIPK